MAHGQIVERGIERAIAVFAGCGVALLLQVVLYAMLLSRTRKGGGEATPDAE
jgi:hypothetical protein